MSPSEAGLLDTSTLILLPHLEDASVLPLRPLISATTLAELAVGRPDPTAAPCQP